eukprot:scaffold11869_cov30-Tisochrysis_lutea.AAC.3
MRHLAVSGLHLLLGDRRHAVRGVPFVPCATDGDVGSAAIARAHVRMGRPRPAGERCGEPVAVQREDTPE